MKNKVIKILLVMMLILTSFILPVNFVYADDEDFTTYTEYDSASRVTVTSDTIAVVNIDHDENAQVYYDFGAGYFDEDWEVLFTLYYPSNDIGDNLGLLLFTHNSIGTTATEKYALESSTSSPDAIWLNFVISNPNCEMRLSEHKNGSADTSGTASTWNRLSYDYTDIYCKVWFDDDAGTYGTMYFRAYSDEDRTIPICSTGSIALTEENSWRYMSWINGYGHIAGGYHITLDIKDGVVTEGTMPEVDNSNEEFFEYHPVTDSYWWTLEGEIIADGGYEQWCYFYWKEDGESTYNSRMLFDKYEEGETFDTIIEIEPDTTYWWYTEISSVLGDFSDVPESFVATVPTNYPPTMATNFFYTATANGTNSICELSGEVYWDGGANVTGYIQYSENVTDWTDSNAYGTPLQTDDTYSINVTGLSENTLYYYRAKGVNANGTDYGGIFTFEIIDWAEPEVEVSVTDVTGTTADINIELTDDGNETEIYTNFRYRIDGEDDWTMYSIGEYMSENETRTVEMVGLTNSTTYNIQAYCFGQCYMQGYCENMSYSEIINFTTTAVQNIPTVTLDTVGYTDQFTMYGTATVLNDAGWDCTISLEYKLAVADDSYWGRNILINPTQFCDGLDTNDSCTTFIYPVSIGKTYAVRARISNALGQFSYSNVVTYLHDMGSTSTDATTTTGYVWLEPVEDFLADYGLNNTGGRLLVVVVVMMIAFFIIVLIPGRKFQEYIRFTVPIAGSVMSIILILGMVIGYVPPVITGVILVVFGGVIAVFIIKIFKSQGGEIE